MGVVPQMLTFVNKGTWLVKNSQKGAYVSYERPLSIKTLITWFLLEVLKVLYQMFGSSKIGNIYVRIFWQCPFVIFGYSQQNWHYVLFEVSKNFWVYIIFTKMFICQKYKWISWRYQIFINCCNIWFIASINFI